MASAISATHAQLRWAPGERLPRLAGVGYALSAGLEHMDRERAALSFGHQGRVIAAPILVRANDPPIGSEKIYLSYLMCLLMFPPITRSSVALDL